MSGLFDRIHYPTVIVAVVLSVALSILIVSLTFNRGEE